MITLNLLSQEQKKAIKLTHIYNFLKKIDYIILIVTILISIMLLTTKIILQNRFNRVVEETTQITKNSQNYNNKVREINAKINAIGQIQDGFINWSHLIYSLTSNLNNNTTTLSYLKIDQPNKTIYLKGNSKTRDDLLLLKQNLEQNQLFSSVDLPMSNILIKDNIDFEIKAKINSSQIK